MPIYEYVCQSCGHALESMQKMSDPQLTDCPACGKPALKKQISATGFVLKGGGWYVTDFRDKGKKKEDAKKDTGGDTKESPKDGSKDTSGDTSKDTSKNTSKDASKDTSGGGDTSASSAAGGGTSARDAGSD